MAIKKRLKLLQERRNQIDKMLSGTDRVDLEAIQDEVREIEAEEKELNGKLEIIESRAAADKINNGDIEVRNLGKVDDIIINENETRTSKKLEAEKRGKQLKEGRSITVASSEIVLPKHTSNTINSTFNEVSSIVDLVDNQTLLGGESYEQPYEKPMNTEGKSEGNYTGLGQNYSDIETITGYATITKSKITAYQEEPEEISKLADASYDSLISASTNKALRKKIAKEILIGDGSQGHLRGIFHNPTDLKAKVIDSNTDIEISTIDSDTLDEIIYSYGGDEEVEGISVLVLNKNDLKEFAKVKNAMGGKVYTIVNQGNKGTINNVPFIISSACGSISNPSTTSGKYCMCYGPIENYKLVIFSDTDIQKSTDYKFKQGMICHKGSIFLGGNVVKWNGFIRVKKGTSVSQRKE